MLNLFKYISSRHFSVRPLRTFLTILGIALGIALFLAIKMINDSTLHSFKENVEAVAGKTALSISAGQAGFDESYLDIISNTPGVLHAVPMIETRAFFSQSSQSKDTDSETIHVLGVDLLKEQSVRTYKTSDEEVIDDPLVFLNQPDSIIITHQFAREKKLNIDSQFSLATVHGSKIFTVRGLLSPQGPAKAYGGSIAIMDIDGARYTFGKEGKLDRVDIVIMPEFSADAVKNNLQKTLGKNFEVHEPATQTETLSKMVQSFQAMMQFFSGLALLVGLFLISNAVNISVAERRKEIGTLRALGAEKQSIWKLFLAESVFMGSMGAVFGVVIAKFLAQWMVKYVAQGMTAQYLTKVEVSEIQFGQEYIFISLAIGVFTSILAAITPSFRATAIQPIEAMKKNQPSETLQNTPLGNKPLKIGGATALGFILFLLVILFKTLKLSNSFPIFHILNQGLILLGVIAIAPALTQTFLEKISAVYSTQGKDSKNFGFIARLALQNLTRNTKRTTSNILSLTVGLILVILISIVQESFRTTLVNWFSKAVPSHLLISSAGNMVQAQVQPIRPEILEPIREVEGVQIDNNLIGKPFAFGLMLVHHQYENQKIVLKAFDHPPSWLNFSIFDVQDQSVQSAGLKLFSPNEATVLVSQNFVMHFKKSTGDFLELATPTGVKNFKIAGIVSDYASAVGVIYLNRQWYEKFWKDPLVGAFGLYVKEGYDPQKVRAAIDRKLDKNLNLAVISNADIVNDLTASVDQAFSYTKAVQWAALLIGLLGLLNTLIISILERTREIGMLRAVGMDKTQLILMIMLEAIYQGIIGSFFAVTIGSFLAYLWITQSLAHILGYIIHFYFPFSSLLFTVIIGILVGIFASIYPAWKASKVNITEALNYE